MVMGCLAVVLQFGLAIEHRNAPLPHAIFRFFSYFTILTNILVALCFALLALRPGSFLGRFFNRPSALTAITVYISMVGIIYNTLLRSLWMPQGLQKVVDEMLHLLMPLFFVAFWTLFVPKTELRWKDILSWLIYPMLYLGFILVSGAFTHFYPYPFIDVADLGYRRSLANGLGILLVFVLFSLLLVGIGKWAGRKEP
jgi:hypothetical protein